MSEVEDRVTEALLEVKHGKGPGVDQTHVKDRRADNVVV